MVLGSFRGWLCRSLPLRPRPPAPLLSPEVLYTAVVLHRLSTRQWPIPSKSLAPINVSFNDGGRQLRVGRFGLALATNPFREASKLDLVLEIIKEIEEEIPKT